MDSTPSFRKRHIQHEGELYLQQRRYVPDNIPHVLEQLISDDMPEQHSTFFENLLYVAIAALDEEGYPWSTLLISSLHKKMLIATALNRLEANVTLPPSDPFAKCVVHMEKAVESFIPKPFALLGVDFRNRRRNKAAGVLVNIDGNAAALHMSLVTNENLGNCPKYITVRTLEYQRRTPETVLDVRNREGIVLSPDCINIIHQASTIFLASTHVDTSCPVQSDVGLNHRGGSPGFVRTYVEGDCSFIVIPDYSGNRFYQSLGNVQSDGKAGIVFPNFATGDICHIIGDAENLFDGEADALMPRISLLTRVKVIAAVLIKGGLNLKQTSPDSFSPYNPPVRYLAREAQTSLTTISAGMQLATLVAVRAISHTIMEFMFELAMPVTFSPGAYIILNCMEHAERKYSHMNDRNPQSLNDDYVRTWTISGCKAKQAICGQFVDVHQISCTIKLVALGTISPFLHSLAHQTPLPRLQLPCLGIGCDFTCFNEGAVPEHMLWVAGGIGITPFFAFHQCIVDQHLDTDIVLLFACRDDDVKLIMPFINSHAITNITIFNSATSVHAPIELHFESRRMQCDDVIAHAHRSAYLCGPTLLTVAVTAWLQDAGCPAIHQEKFAF